MSMEAAEKFLSACNRACAWVGKCHGGCRASAYNDGGGYYSVDPHTCHFFRAGWYERFAAAAQKGEKRLV